MVMAGEKILSIDDSPTVQRLIEMILSSQGYQVILASDGEEGIAKAQSERPSVILVDFVMPKMNGFPGLQDFKGRPRLQRYTHHSRDVQGRQGRQQVRRRPRHYRILCETIPARRTPCQDTGSHRPEKTRGGCAVSRGQAGARSAQAGAARRLQRRRGSRTWSERPWRGPSKTSLKPPCPIWCGGSWPGPSLRATRASRGTWQAAGSLKSCRCWGSSAQTGRLVINRGGDSAEIYFGEGAVVFAASNCNGVRSAMEGLLRRSCRLPDDRLRHVLQTSETTGEPVDSILARKNSSTPRPSASI